MNCQELFERLDDYHAGTLPRDEAELLEQHLLSCEDCRGDFRFQRELRRGTASLPKGVHPPSDLWTGIAERIGGSSSTISSPVLPRRPWWQTKPGLIAAAILLMAVSSAITAVLVRHGRPSSAPIAVAPDFQVTEATYLEAASELSRTLESRRRSLSPAALAVVEQNLRIIDEAIREARAALATDPHNHDVANLLWGSYEKKIDLLRRAAENRES
jgi:hypothetical protein